MSMVLAMLFFLCIGRRASGVDVALVDCIIARETDQVFVFKGYFQSESLMVNAAKEPLAGFSAHRVVRRAQDGRKVAWGGRYKSRCFPYPRANTGQKEHY
ncbi:hypothetical protein [Paraburkholderia hospita]|uniref:hypothetical protein n=1 Tax=Paraburkholderia hospita TaxID=169430 RepID=UPI003ED07C93